MKAAKIKKLLIKCFLLVAILVIGGYFSVFQLAIQKAEEVRHKNQTDITNTKKKLDQDIQAVKKDLSSSITNRGYTEMSADQLTSKEITSGQITSGQLTASSGVNIQGGLVSDGPIQSSTLAATTTPGTISMYHDGTNGHIDTNKGSIYISPYSKYTYIGGNLLPAQGSSYNLGSGLAGLYNAMWRDIYFTGSLRDGTFNNVVSVAQLKEAYDRAHNYLNQGVTTTSSPTFAGLMLNSNLSLGTNTLTTSNTTKVANLNADMLDGYHVADILAGSLPPGGTVADYLRGDGTWRTLNATAVQGLGALATLDAINNGQWSGTALAVANGGTGAIDAAGARTNLGLAIGTDVQAYNLGLADIASLAKTDGNIIVGNGTNWVAENGAIARTSLGLGSMATQDSNNVSISGGAITGTSINGATISGGTLSGGNVSGGTLTASAVNGVNTADIIVSSGSYANPLWMTSLAGSKVSGDISGNSAGLTGTPNITVGTISSGAITTSGNMSFNGDAAKTITEARNTSNAAGNGLTLQGGGAYSGGTNLNGGDLTLSSGISTGLASSNVYIQTATATGPISTISATPTASGSATYVVGDILTISEGTGGTVRVDTVSAGQVTSVSLQTAGTGYTTGVGKLTTGGSGSGCTINITAVLGGTTDQTPSTKLSVLGNGNVGIGTTAPGSKLTVQANPVKDGASPIIKIQGSTGTELFRISANVVDNLFMGNSAGNAISSTGVSTQGLYDTFVGTYAGMYNTTGHYNTFVGNRSGTLTTTGDHNTMIGMQSGYENTTGQYNTYLGITSGQDGTTASHNVALGDYAGMGNVNGDRNIFVGSYAGYNRLMGWGDILQGYNAGSSGKSGAYNISLGVNSLYNDYDGIGNVSMGTYSLFNNKSSTDRSITTFANSAGSEKVTTLNAHGLAVGDSVWITFNSMASTEVTHSAKYSVATVVDANNFTIARTYDAANDLKGYWERGATISDNGSGKVRVTSNHHGVPNGGLVTLGGTGSNSTYEGIHAATLIDANTFDITDMTYSASYTSGWFLYEPQAGNNVALGSYAGYANTTGYNNMFLGYNAGNSGTTGTLQNATAIGYNAQVTASNSIILGGTGSDAVKIGIGTAAPNQKIEVDYGNLRFNQEPAPGALTATVTATAGNPNGTYQYAVTFVTADGETEAGTASTAVSPALKQVSLTNIPLGSSKVTSRKIYRSSEGEHWPGYTNKLRNAKLVTTLANNTATTYTDNIADGSLGAAAPYNNTTGGSVMNGTVTVMEADQGVTRLGYNAGSVNQGASNTFVGINSGQNNTTADYITAVGINSLQSNTSGWYNVALGAHTLTSNTTGYSNVAIGTNTLHSNVTGANNTGIGTDVQRDTTGNNNTSIGSHSLHYTTTGNNNAAVGDFSLYSNTTGNHNAANGSMTLYSNTTGSNNSAVGYTALFGNTVGAFNAADGFNSLSNTNPTASGAITAFANSATEPGVKTTVTSAGHGRSNGTMVTIYDPTDAFGNSIYKGAWVVSNVSANTFDIAKVYSAEAVGGSKWVAGGGNTALGALSGVANTTGSANTFIGYNAGATSTATLQNATAIGYNAQVTASNSIVLGGTGSTDSVNVGIGTAAPTAKLDVKSTQTSGTLLSLSAPSATTLAGQIYGQTINLLTNYTATNQSAMAQNIYTPSVTNTGAGNYYINGSWINGGAIVQNTAAGGSYFTGYGIQMPNITQTTGTVTAVGVGIYGGTVTSGTSYALVTTATAGNVGIGTTTPGYHLDVQGGTGVAADKVNSRWGYLTNGADYAEYFHTNDTDLSKGEAVCLDSAAENSVKRCTSAADQNLIGVISDNASLVGNGAGPERDNDPHYKIVGMLGQISSKVSSENGSVVSGDLLTSANAAGYLRKANAGEAVVGKAMQSLGGGTGTIKVLVNPQSSGINTAIDSLTKLTVETVNVTGDLKVKTAEVDTLIVTGDATFKGTLTLENGLKIDTKGPKPVCDTTKRGTLWVTQGGSGVEDITEICIKDSADNYLWKKLY